MPVPFSQMLINSYLSRILPPAVFSADQEVDLLVGISWGHDSARDGYNGRFGREEEEQSQMCCM